MESLREWKNSEEILEEFLQNGNECEMKNEMKRKETEKIKGTERCPYKSAAAGGASEGFQRENQ